VFNRILVPLDGSKLAEQVLPLSCYLAKQFQATLILFHVVEKNAPTEIHGQRHLREAAEAKTYLDRVAQQYSSEKVLIVQDVHEVQEHGVAQTIRDHVRELQADSIVLCAHGHGGLRDIVFGSIAQQVIRQVTIPVLFIRPNSMKDSAVRPIAQILLPLDGSESHEAAIPIATHFAARCQAKVCLVTVVPTPETLPGKEVIAGRFYPNAEALSLDISAQQAENYLHKVAQNLLSHGVTASRKVLRGEVASQVIEAMESESIDLAILATHGHRAFDAHWQGSLAPGLLSKTSLPVILVHVSENSPD